MRSLEAILFAVALLSAGSTTLAWPTKISDTPAAAIQRRQINNVGHDNDNSNWQEQNRDDASSSFPANDDDDDETGASRSLPPPIGREELANDPPAVRLAKRFLERERQRGIELGLWDEGADAYLFSTESILEVARLLTAEEMVQFVHDREKERNERLTDWALSVDPYLSEKEARELLEYAREAAARHDPEIPLGSWPGDRVDWKYFDESDDDGSPGLWEND